METMEVASSNLLQQAERFVETFYKDRVDEKYLYHNFQHVRDVVDATRRLGQLHGLSEDNMELLLLAAWFHDTGFDQGAEGHEDRSIRHLENFLSQWEYPETKVQQIAALISATRISVEPNDLLEQIIRDADYSHLGSELYWDRCNRVRQELLMTRRNFMPEGAWVQFELDFMTNHQYYTEIARQLYDVTKQKNIKQLKKYQQRIQPNEQEAEEEKKKKKKKRNQELKELDLGRGVETMFRATYRTHINLSSIADNKANIMLSINAIIISIVISSLVPKFRDNPQLMAPTFVLLAVCLTALVLAILATQPKITKGSFTRDDIAHKRSNLLFFGNFYNMPIEDFHWGMMEMIKDSDFLYSSMTRDLYYLGKVLAQKYRYLRFCYGVFMYGLIVSVLVFGLVFLM